MRQKLMTILLVTLILLTNTITISFANDTSNFNNLTAQEIELLSSINLEEEIYKAQNDITDVEISDEIYRLLSAYTTNNNGDTEEVEVKATIKNLGIVSKNGTTGVMYTLTAVTNGVTKTDSGNASKRGSSTYASVTWIDNFGMQNQLVSVSGGWNPGPNTLNNRVVNYGVTSDDSKKAFRTPTSNSFSYQGSSNMIGFTLFVDTYVYIEEYQEALTLIVYSSFFS